MNFVPALVLFNSGASHSFMSTSFCRGFSVAREAIDGPLKVVIANDRTV